MKNITKILFAAALALPVIGNAQNASVSTTPENRNAVIEEWTGIYCQYCPSGHAAVEAAITDNPGDVVGINFHSGSYANPNPGDPDFRTPEGNIHDGAFGPTGYPSSTLNRKIIGGAQLYHPGGSNDANKVPTIIAQSSEVNMNIVANLDVTTRQLNVAVEYFYTDDAPSPANELYVAVLQNNVEGPQTGGSTYNPDAILPNGNYNHQHMFRQMLSAQWGDAINTTITGSNATVNYSVTLPMNINGIAVDIANIGIAAYINDGTQTVGEVLTATYTQPTLTGFPTSDEVIFNSALMNDVFDCYLAAQTVSPTATLQNWGSNAMTSATITYDVNSGTPVVMNWTGNISPGISEVITLDPITFTPNLGGNTLNVVASNPNGTADVTTDNEGSTSFTAYPSADAETYTVTVNLTTDRYASETTWDITNGAGTVVASAGPWANLAANGVTVQTPVDVNINANDCYTFTLYDSYGDGINSGYGNGSYSVEDGNGNVLKSGATFTSEDLGLFKTTSDASINEVIFEEVSIFPNPASEVLNVNFSTEATDFVVSILDLQGRVLASQSGSKNVTFPVADLASGSYLVTISTENGVHTESVVIK